eukprot:EG_transcript_48038
MLASIDGTQWPFTLQNRQRWGLTDELAQGDGSDRPQEKGLLGHSVGKRGEGRGGGRGALRLQVRRRFRLASTLVGTFKWGEERVQLCGAVEVKRYPSSRRGRRGAKVRIKTL